MKCGVGDYTSHLAMALSRCQDAEVAVLTDARALDVSRKNGMVNIWPIVKGDVRDISSVIGEIRRWKPDVAHIQFPTMGYSRWKRLQILLPFIFWLMRVPVVMTWHEPVRIRELMWIGALVMRGLVVVRPNYFDVASWLHRLVSRKKFELIPNASTIPVSRLEVQNVAELRRELRVGNRSLVVYFGFAFPNKAVEQVFEVANPHRDFLVLLCELDTNSAYHQKLLSIIGDRAWSGRVCVTGFLPADKVGAILGAADAVILPFRKGGGEWNTSAHAVIDQGTFLLTTSAEKHGYVPAENAYYARPGDISDMREALPNYLGHKSEPNYLRSRNRWQEIADAHMKFYRDCL